MKIIKSIRKTITLKVDRDWEIIVKVPYFTNQKTIDSFLERHKDWIDKRQVEIIKTKKSFSEWEKIFYMWDEFYIVFSDLVKKIIFKWNDIIIPKTFKKNIKEKLAQFYKKQAKEYIELRLENIANLNDLKFNKLRITSAKTRWWSCSSNKNLNFSFRLILAPSDTIDYVIIHELAHLRHMNHSKNFRQEVENMSKKLWLYDYKKSKNWLKDNWQKISYI